MASVTTQPLAPTAECASPGVAPIDRDVAREQAQLLKAVADPVRLQILSIIRGSAEQEACGCDMTGVVGVSQPTVSHHLKVLTKAGLVRREKRGTWAWFSLVPERVEQISQIFATSSQ